MGYGDKSKGREPLGRRIAQLGALAFGCLALAGCSASTSKLTSRLDPKYGVSASPRVIEPGQPVPKGGGVYRVGRPYVVAGRTYTPEEIKRQIAQAEIDAYFRNDPDAALSASRRLGASFVLRGLISSQATQNPMMNVNQVSVNMGFTLTASNGRMISDTEAHSSSYAGADVGQMALTLVNEKADEVVATLYADYCRNAIKPK